MLSMRFLAPILLALSLLVVTDAALAQTIAPAADVVVAPNSTVEPAANSTTVVVPYGDWLETVLSNFAEVIIGIVIAIAAWASRSLPAGIQAAFRLLRVEQFLARGIDYAINATRGAVKGKELDINVGSEVVAQALGYLLDKVPGWFLEWVGGIDSLKQMIVARLNLQEQATAAEVIAAAEPKVMRLPLPSEILSRVRDRLK